MIGGGGAVSASKGLRNTIMALQSKYWLAPSRLIIIIVRMALNFRSNPSLPLPLSEASFPDLPSDSDRFACDLRHKMSIRSAKSSQRPSDSLLNEQISSRKDSSLNSRTSLPRQPPSSNHNFQKHLVVTIRKLGRRVREALEVSGRGLAQQMWNIFLSAGIKSKKILVILFGRAELKQEKYKQLLKNCFFGEFCSYEETAVRNAQDVLRATVLRLLGDEQLRGELQRSRHIRQQDQFLAYLGEFTDLLRQGPLLKFRINPVSCRRIEERVRSAVGLREQKARRRVRSRVAG